MILNNKQNEAKLQHLDVTSLGELLLTEQFSHELSQELRQALGKTVKDILEFRFHDAYTHLEELLRKWLSHFWQEILNRVFSSEVFLNILKRYGGQKGYKYRRMLEKEVYLPGGIRCRIKSPYFLKKGRKKGKKKKGPNGRGCHLGLEVLGFIQNVSPSLGMKAIAYALVCPSFDFASKLLEQEGIKLDAKQLSMLCQEVGEKLFKNRVKSLLKEGESLRGCRVVITVDGGRSRHRVNKRGKRKKGQKGCGYHSDWIEPKIFVIYVVNEEGKVESKVKPFVDGSIQVDNFMDLLSSYLKELKIEEAQEVVLCGDGAPWIWKRIPQLLLDLGVSAQKLFEVLDYTHGKQNLNEVYEKLSKKQREKISLKQWKDWLWEGKIDKIKEDIKRVCQKGGQKALAKLKSYFEKNKHRMHYKEMDKSNRPCGSGAVESAIRRVINLRLKSCGTFWKEEKLEIMIYLRAQLLYGRWVYLYINWLKVN